MPKECKGKDQGPGFVNTVPEDAIDNRFGEIIARAKVLYCAKNQLIEDACSSKYPLGGKGFQNPGANSTELRGVEYHFGSPKNLALLSIPVRNCPSVSLMEVFLLGGEVWHLYAPGLHGSPSRSLRATAEFRLTLGGACDDRPAD
jgi:hypothetical protein